MRLNMEANQVGAQQAIEQFPLPRTDGEGLGIGPGNMPEDGDARVRTLPFENPGQRREVTLVPFGGLRKIYGFQQKIMGDI